MSKIRFDIDAVESALGIKRLTEFRLGQRVKCTANPWKKIVGKTGTIEAVGQETYLVKFKGISGCTKMLPGELEAV